MIYYSSDCDLHSAIQNKSIRSLYKLCSIFRICGTIDLTTILTENVSYYVCLCLYSIRLIALIGSTALIGVPL